MLVSSLALAINANGRYICFEPEETFNQDGDDCSVSIGRRGAKPEVNVATNGDAGNNGGLGCAISGDATVIASMSPNGPTSVYNDTNNNYNVFGRMMFPEMALDKTALTFAATTSGTTFVTQTAAQTIGSRKADSGSRRGR